MFIRVGKRYITRSGHLVEIHKRKKKTRCPYPFEGTIYTTQGTEKQKEFWTKRGRHLADRIGVEEDEYDLTREAPPV